MRKKRGAESADVEKLEPKASREGDGECEDVSLPKGEGPVEAS